VVDESRKKLIERINKLLAKADRTEYPAEAEIARNLAADLLSKHNISVEAITVKAPFEQIEVRTGKRRRQHHELNLLNALARFNGVWLLSQSDAFIYVGSPSDVQATQYHYDIVKQQREVEFAEFMMGPEWAASRMKVRGRWVPMNHRVLKNSWMHSFANGVFSKVSDLMKRAEVKQQAQSLAIVPRHEQAEAWYRGCGYEFGKGSGGGYRLHIDQAFQAGRNVSLAKGVEQGSAVLLLEKV
jgi:Protein of unknown function (DUF2786)